jgi:hypothetical protein
LPSAGVATGNPHAPPWYVQVVVLGMGGLLIVG